MTLRSQLLEVDGPFRFLRAPGPWFYSALVLGASLRIFYVVFTEGTLDVDIWQEHAHCVSQSGPLACYRDGLYTFNHPPPMGLIASGLYALARESGVSFATLFRMPFALLDGLTALFFLIALKRAEKTQIRNARFVLVALYWINPLAAVLSSYHGNTDIAIAFFLLAALLHAARGRSIASGVLLGLSLWIKIPGVLGAPILLLALPSWRGRFQFCAAFALSAGVGYAPWLIQDPELVTRSVFLYQGLLIQTTHGTSIWGLQIFFPFLAELHAGFAPIIAVFRKFYLQWNTLICLVPILVFAALRQNRASTDSLIQGLAASYMILYGLTNFWAFQYLAWSMPFWFLLGPGLAAAIYTASLAYIYGLYLWLSGGPLLLGSWAFVEKPDWPSALLWLRDANVLIFFFVAAYLLLSTAYSSFLRWRRTGRPLRCTR